MQAGYAEGVSRIRFGLRGKNKKRFTAGKGALEGLQSFFIDMPEIQFHQGMHAAVFNKGGSGNDPLPQFLIVVTIKIGDAIIPLVFLHKIPAIPAKLIAVLDDIELEELVRTEIAFPGTGNVLGHQPALQDQEYKNEPV